MKREIERRIEVLKFDVERFTRFKDDKQNQMVKIYNSNDTLTTEHYKELLELEGRWRYYKGKIKAVKSEIEFLESLIKE